MNSNITHFVIQGIHVHSSAKIRLKERSGFYGRVHLPSLIGQIQHALGDYVQLHFGGSAFNGIGS